MKRKQNVGYMHYAKMCNDKTIYKAIKHAGKTEKSDIRGKTTLQVN